jgi:dTDP-4-dehydrorhamnose 3,5-epimerase-like enzyme
LQIDWSLNGEPTLSSKDAKIMLFEQAEAFA